MRRWRRRLDAVESRFSRPARSIAISTPNYNAPSVNPFGLANVGPGAAPSFADIDNDGDLDAFIGAAEASTLTFFRNTGSQTAPAFASEGQTFGLSGYGGYPSPAFMDIDGDGDLDAFVGTYGSGLVLYRNTGSASSPAFQTDATDIGLAPFSVNAKLAFVDIDGDGLLDAFVGTKAGAILYFRNTGTQTQAAFSQQSDNFGLAVTGSNAAPTFADIDGDGDADGLIENHLGFVFLYLNSGTPSAPVFVLQEDHFGLVDGAGLSRPVLVDLDGDGDQDVVVGDALGNSLYFANQNPTLVVSVGDNAVTVGEGGASDTLSIALSRAPAFPVQVQARGENAQLQAGETLVFTAENWATPQILTVRATDDQQAEGLHRGALGFVVSSRDRSYEGIKVPAVPVSIADNDLVPGDPVFGAALLPTFGPGDTGTYAIPAFADIDADGDVDLAVGDVDGSTRFFLNTGSASAPAFASIPAQISLPGVAGSAAPAFADIDGDGDLDVLIGSNTGALSFELNEGNGLIPAFASTPAQFGLTAVSAFSKPAFVDIDADGDPDLFVGVQNGDVLFFRNVGNATAPAWAAGSGNFGLAFVGGSAAPTFVDFDGDGDLDAVIGTSELHFFRNTGTASAPAFTVAGSTFGAGDPGEFVAPAFADLNADGDMDALVGNNLGEIRFLENGATVLPAVLLQPSNGGTQVTEGGGTDDYTLVLQRAPTSDVFVYFSNNGQVSTDTAVLQFTPSNWNVPQQVTVIAVDDSVGEGPHAGAVQHTVVSEDPRYANLPAPSLLVQVLDNDLEASEPAFARPLSLGIGGLSAGARPALADVDGDGDVDLLIDFDGGIGFIRNTGTASAAAFTPESDLQGLAASGNHFMPALADIDGDGDLDALVGSDNGSLALFANTGSLAVPAFTAIPGAFGLGNSPTGLTAPALADIDGDGDVDVFVGQQDGTLRYFANTGSASAPAFALQSGNFGLGSVGTSAVPTFVDMDGDGDLDAFVGADRFHTGGSNLRVFRNTGTASAPAFTPESSTFGLVSDSILAATGFADVDADGREDAFTVDVGGNLQLFRNLGSSHVLPVFTAVPTSFSLVDTAFVDDFPTRTAQLGATGTGTISYGIVGGAGFDNLVFKNSSLGSFSINALTGAIAFEPNVPFIESLSVSLSLDLQLTASDGISVVSVPFSLVVSQVGTTESSGDDVLVGNADRNVMQGLDGNDDLDGAGGIDTASYALAESPVRVSLALAGAQDTLGAGIDTLRHFENLIGSGFADTLTGNAGANRLDGLGGSDHLVGLGGDDVYVVDRAGDVVTEGAKGGTDTVLSAAPSYTLASNVEIGRITVATAASLTGNALGNTLVGGAGRNVLTGLGGSDKLTGGTGADTFDFNALSDSGITASTRDQILDFSRTAQDRIDLRGIDANSGKGGDQAFNKLTNSGTAFSAANSFTAPGQLFFERSTHVLYGNVDADPAPEFSLKVLGPATLITGDFFL